MLLVFVDIENGRISGEDQEVVDQLEGKLNAINKSATDAYNSIISNAQVMCCIIKGLVVSKNTPCIQTH